MSKWKEIQQELENRRANLTSRLQRINVHLRQQDAPLSPDWSEQAIELENEEVLQALDQNSRHELEQIKNALARIQNQTYGICAECGDDISEKRLKALPFASLCIQCAQSAERH